MSVIYYAKAIYNGAESYHNCLNLTLKHLTLNLEPIAKNHELQEDLIPTLNTRQLEEANIKKITRITPLVELDGTNNCINLVNAILEDCLHQRRANHGPQRLF